MSIDLKDLRYFMAVSTAGSITAAAEILHIAQPALSVQMRQFEADLGVQLLRRTRKGVEMTTAGVIVQTRAAEILNLVDRLYMDVQDTGAQAEGSVAIGLPQSMAKLLTLALIQAAAEEFPRVHLKIIELSTGFVPLYLQKGNIDIGITFLRKVLQHIKYEDLIKEELVLLGAPDQFSDFKAFRAERALSLPFSWLEGRPMVLPESNHSLRQIIDESKTVPLLVRTEVNSIPQLLELAGAGIGLTILGYASAHDSLKCGLVSAARVTSPNLERTVQLCRSTATQPTVASIAISNLIHRLVDQMKLDGRWQVLG